jgi:hypothetical protein
MTDNQTDTTHPHLLVIENMTTGEVVAVRRLEVIKVKENTSVVESSLSRTQIAAEHLEEGVEAVALSQGLLGITIGIEIAKGTETGVGIRVEAGVGIRVETGIGIRVETGREREHRGRG